MLFICNAEHLICEYGEWEYTLLPLRQHCTIRNFDLSKSVENEELTFSGSYYEKNRIKCLVFYYSRVVEYIPTDFRETFPNMNQFEISRSNIPVVKVGLFTKDLNFLKNLDLYQSKIKDIEKDAFAELVNLEWLMLNENNLRKLSANIFEKNEKLRFIALGKNQIHSIVPDFFKPLTNLEVLVMNENSCVDRTMKTEDGSLEKIDEFLGNCYENDKRLVRSCKKTGLDLDGNACD